MRTTEALGERKVVLENKLLRRGAVVFFKDGPYLPLTENWIHGQAAHLLRYEPTVYCFGVMNQNFFPIARIQSIEPREVGRLGAMINKLGNRLGWLPYFSRRMKHDRPTLIHAHFGPAGYRALPLKRRYKIPMITTFYGSDMSKLPRQKPWWKARYQRLFAEGERFLVEGAHMKQCLIDLGCPEQRVTVNHLGINAQKIPFKARRFNEEAGARILIACSFREKKGIPWAIEAFGRVRQAHPSQRLSLTLLGDATPVKSDQREKQRILAMIKRYRLEDSIRLLGYQPHSVFIEQLYQHDIFLSPSVTAVDGDTEGGVPVSIIEASASGMPIVSSTHCDIPEVVMDRTTGFLAPERDVEALTAKLEAAIMHPERWELMGEKARTHIEHAYDLGTQTARLEQIYDEVQEPVDYS